MLTYFKNFLSISKKQWNGLVVMLALMACVFVGRFVCQRYGKDTIIHFRDLNNAVKRLAPGHNKTPDYHTSAKLFKFNPNGLSIEKWQQLGLTMQQADVIKHYEEKGGRFYSRADVKKMYSLSAADYQRLEPNIDLPEKYIRKTKLTTPVELNTADSAKLTTIYGIGPSFARRIINYRKLLGGFYSKTQLKEVYGLDVEKYDEIKDQVTVNPKQVKLINVNLADANELNRLPYLNYKQANAIVQYRIQHGLYQSADDLENIMIIDHETINKIKPYLTFINHD